MEKEETAVIEPTEEPIIEPVIDKQDEDKEAEDGAPAAARKQRKKVTKEPSQGEESRKARSKTRLTTKKHSEKDVTNKPASSAKSLVQPIPPGIASDDISEPPAVEKTNSEKKPKRQRKLKERKVDEDADAPESDGHQPKVTRKLSKLFSRASKMSESGNSGIVMQDSTADMKGKSPRKAKKSASKDPTATPRKARRNRLDSKKNTSSGKASQPIPQTVESMSSDNFKQRSDKKLEEMSENKLTRRSSEWSDDEEAGGLPRTDSRMQRMTRAVRQLFCCGAGAYESASEENPSQYTM